MSRRLSFRLGEEPRRVLEEVEADDEHQLQERLKDEPWLLPVDELDLEGPVLVIGRETRLSSGSVDLLALSREGRPLIVEFKTGPQNGDFRSALAQLLDYGGALYEMPLTTFESTVALRYLQGDQCPATAPGARATSLDEAIAAAWPELSAEDRASALAELERSLEAGDFAFLLVAQRFTDSMQRTTQYLNDQLRGPLVHLVELVRFRGEDVEAFEARVVLRGGRTRRAGGTTTMRVEDLVAAFPASATESVARLLETAETLGLHVVPGSVGLSLRIDAPEREEPVSVGWLFPPGRSGWYGLRDLTLGFDPGTAAAVPGLALILRRHAERVAAIPGSLAPNKADFPGARFTPELLVARHRAVIHALEELAAEVGGG